MALFEYRVYEVTPGRMPALNRRFQTMTLNHFRNHGIGVVGFWEAVVGTTNELHYLLRFDDMAHRERAWRAFATSSGAPRSIHRCSSGRAVEAQWTIFNSRVMTFSSPVTAERA